MPFEGSTAIVTGGASGLGLAITEALAERGTKVAMFDIQAEGLDAEASRLRAAGGTVNGYVVDVSDRAASEPPSRRCATNSARCWSWSTAPASNSSASSPRSPTSSGTA